MLLSAEASSIYIILLSAEASSIIIRLCGSIQYYYWTVRKHPVYILYYSVRKHPVYIILLSAEAPSIIIIIQCGSIPVLLLFSAEAFQYYNILYLRHGLTALEAKAALPEAAWCPYPPGGKAACPPVHGGTAAASCSVRPDAQRSGGKEIFRETFRLVMNRVLEPDFVTFSSLFGHFLVTFLTFDGSKAHRVTPGQQPSRAAVLLPGTFWTPSGHLLRPYGPP